MPAPHSSERNSAWLIRVCTQGHQLQEIRKIGPYAPQVQENRATELQATGVVSPMPAKLFFTYACWSCLPDKLSALARANAFFYRGLLILHDPVAESTEAPGEPCCPMSILRQPGVYKACRPSGKLKSAMAQPAPAACRFCRRIICTSLQENAGCTRPQLAVLLLLLRLLLFLLSLLFLFSLCPPHNIIW